MKSKLAAIMCLVGGTLVSTSASRASADHAWENVVIGGFFSQGYLYSSNNNYPTIDKGGTWDFREMAVNASTTIGSHIRVGAQAFAQRLGELGDDKVILDWAVIDYNFSPAFGIRAGRVKYPKGLYGEALDLDVVRPFVFLPGAVYSPILRDFSASFDGGMVYGSANIGKSSFDYKVFYGDIPISPSKGVAEFFNDSGFFSSAGVAHLNMDSVAGGQLAWITPIRGLKFVYSRSFYRNLAASGPFSAYPAVSLTSNIERFTWDTVSAEYTRGNWTFASEWQRAEGTFDYSANPLLPSTASPVGWDGYYVSAARRLGGRFEVGTYFGYLKNRHASSASLPSGHQADYALSLRYDVSEHVLFKLEAHRLDGTYQTFNTTRIPNPAATRQDATTLFTAKTTFSF